MWEYKSALKSPGQPDTVLITLHDPDTLVVPGVDDKGNPLPGVPIEQVLPYTKTSTRQTDDEFAAMVKREIGFTLTALNESTQSVPTAATLDVSDAFAPAVPASPERKKGKK